MYVKIYLIHTYSKSSRRGDLRFFYLNRVRSKLEQCPLFLQVKEGVNFSKRGGPRHPKRPPKKVVTQTIKNFISQINLNTDQYGSYYLDFFSQSGQRRNLKFRKICLQLKIGERVVLTLVENIVLGKSRHIFITGISKSIEIARSG